LEPYSVDEVQNFILSPKNNKSIRSHLVEMSYRKTILTGDVFGWETLPYTVFWCPDFWVLRDETIKKLDPVVNFNDYKRLLIIIPQHNYCNWSGVGTIGMIPTVTQDGTVNLSVAALNGDWGFDYTITHELGHNFGVWHANDWECGDTAIGNNCTSIPYGDTYDSMGYSSGRAHFNAIHKEQLGWFDSGEDILEIKNGMSGNYFIELIEREIFSREIFKPAEEFKIELRPNPFPKISYKTLTDVGHKYYFEFRRPIGFDSYIADLRPPDAFDGLLIHLNSFKESGDTQLLDLSPNVNVNSLDQLNDSRDVVLRVGETFHVPVFQKFNITLKSITDDFAMVEIETICGNGEIDEGETCDDGNGESGDGCSRWCQLDCGNDRLDSNEECDDGNRVDGDGCSSTCELECGNGVIDRNEQCDDGNLLDNDGCSSACLIEFCGDGIINLPGEACDGAAGVPEHYICTNACTLEYVPYCGDGAINQPNEECDGFDGVPEHYICTNACTLEYVPYCGDGILNTQFEICDGSDLGGKTCLDIGFRQGELNCINDINPLNCTFDDSSCFDPICGLGHDFNGSPDTCTATFFDDLVRGDLYVEGITGSIEDWELLKLSTTATGFNFGQDVNADFNTSNSFLINKYYTDTDWPIHSILSGNLSAISRLSLPYDTSSIPFGANILSARLILPSVFPHYSHFDDSFISLVNTDFASPPGMVLDDFDKFGIQEGSSRLHVSDFSSGRRTFNLNQDGLSWINKDGWTMLGLRVGYDIQDMSDVLDENVLDGNVLAFQNGFYYYLLFQPQSNGNFAELKVVYEPKS